MKKWYSVLLVVVMMCAMLMLVGCENYVNIPAGYSGRILTQTGWQEDWLGAGQVNIGQQQQNGATNQLVLLEVTSETIMESFDQAKTAAEGGDGEDHRVLTQDGVPVSVDVYVRLMVPNDKGIMTQILAQVTPNTFKGDPANVARIQVNDIYVKFAQPEVRGAIRALFAQYPNYEAVYADFANIPTKLGSTLTDMFKKSNIPLSMMDVSLSNVKPDEALWAAKNNQASADAQVQAIQKIGDAMKNNPGYVEYLKWQQLLEIAKTCPNVTIIVGDGNTPSISIPVGQTSTTAAPTPTPEATAKH